MNEKSYVAEYKKIIRKLIKEVSDKDLEKHIYIIKSTLFYISKIVLIRLKNKNTNIDDIFKSLLIDIEDVREYEYSNLLDSQTKFKLKELLNDIDEEELKKLSLGELYDAFTTNNEKKLLGQVYTPKDVVKAMIDSNLNSENIIRNPYFRVIDPACGGGYFLTLAYDKIKRIVIDNYDQVKSFSKETEEELEEGIDFFILKNNIWGTDIDSFAVYMTRFALAIRSSGEALNIFKLDALIDDENILKEEYFDLVISNPPYIGHKKINKDYRALLAEKYSDVYSDKGDISYCFFKRAHQLLKCEGKISYITSRYFLESPSGAGLREFLKKNFAIKKIIDFYGENIFKGIGISPVIIEATKDNYENKNIIDVYKRKYNNKTESFKKNLESNFINFSTEQDRLKDDGWILLSIEERELFDKIDSFGDRSLGELCVFKQGIITGCDKAFIIDQEELNDKEYEKDLIKPWIKNSDIDKYYLKDIKKYIIYTDKIDLEKNYPKALQRIHEYKDTLNKRRECIKGIRKWYELQWGREEEIFKNEKIVFPYKADRNKFTIVRDEICSSADIYFIMIKEEKVEQISLEYLVAFLNSKIFEFYFKCTAKKLNDKLYEYYPNKLVNLKLKLIDDKSYLEPLVKDIETSYKKKDHLNAHKLQEKIDKYLYKLYSLNKDEIELIENTVDKLEGEI